MEHKKYFEEIREKIRNMSDADFDRLLAESGLEECPEDIAVSTFIVTVDKTGTYQKAVLYSSENKYKDYTIGLKVA